MFGWVETQFQLWSSWWILGVDLGNLDIIKPKLLIIHTSFLLFKIGNKSFAIKQKFKFVVPRNNNVSFFFFFEMWPRIRLWKERLGPAPVNWIKAVNPLWFHQSPQIYWWNDPLVDIQGIFGQLCNEPSYWISTWTCLSRL